MASPSPRVPGTARRQTKGERTRARLKQAARQVLGTRGYRAARVADITQAAGLSQGAFYPYFQNKREIALEVMGELLDEGRSAMLSAPRRDDAFDEILAPTRAYVDFLFAHGPLVRALLQAADEDGEFAGLWQDTTRAWLTRAAAVIDRRCGSPAVDEPTLLLVAYAVNWMVDGFLHSLLGRRDPYQEALVRSPEHLAEALSVLWFRAVYACNPDPDRLTCIQDILRLQLAGSGQAAGIEASATNTPQEEEST